MNRRHLVYGIIFITLFAVGSLNVATDGRFAHMISGQMPWHPAPASATPEIEINDNLTIESGSGTVRARISNAQKISYRIYNKSNNVHPDFDFQPGVNGVQQSLPPYYNWDHPEKEIYAELSFETSELEDGEYIYSLEARNGDSESTEKNFTIMIG